MKLKVREVGLYTYLYSQSINFFIVGLHKNIAKSNKLINSNVNNTKYKYYIRKIVDKIFKSHQNLYSIKSMSKNIYHKKPKFGIKTRHNLHG